MRKKENGRGRDLFRYIGATSESLNSSIPGHLCLLTNSVLDSEAVGLTLVYFFRSSLVLGPAARPCLITQFPLPGSGAEWGSSPSQRQGGGD